MKFHTSLPGGSGLKVSPLNFFPPVVVCETGDGRTDVIGITGSGIGVGTGGGSFSSGGGPPVGRGGGALPGFNM